MSKEKEKEDKKACRKKACIGHYLIQNWKGEVVMAIWSPLSSLDDLCEHTDSLGRSVRHMHVLHCEVPDWGSLPLTLPIYLLLKKAHWKTREGKWFIIRGKIF